MCSDYTPNTSLNTTNSTNFQSSFSFFVFDFHLCIKKDSLGCFRFSYTAQVLVSAFLECLIIFDNYCSWQIRRNNDDGRVWQLSIQTHSLNFGQYLQPETQTLEYVLLVLHDLFQYVTGLS